MAIFLKDPAAVVDYVVDWQTAYLEGQTIVASVWNIEPDEADGVEVAAASFDAGRSQATLRGGRQGQFYRLHNRVTFSDGGSDERSLALRVEDR